MITREEYEKASKLVKDYILQLQEELNSVLLKENSEQYYSLNQNASEFDISCRCYNILKANNVRNGYDLIKYKREDFMRWRNLGKRSLAEIEYIFKKLGFELK